ncbi:MAG: ABC transporter permease subunit [Bdellovibrionales bacterium]|nr:ABC transporter permease subunit [Bdellovibrionales bacterium]
MKTFLSSFRSLFAIARVTFEEIILDKILYNFLLFAFLLIGVSYLASQLTFVGQERVIFDLGLSAINLSCGVIAVFQGGAMIAREFERRTVFVVLARPISRLQFIFGKFFGLAAVLLVNWVLLAGTEILLFLSLGGEMNGTRFVAMAFLWAQACFLAAFTFFFASFSTASVSIMLVIGIYLIGNNVESLRQILSRPDTSAIAKSFLPLVGLMPNLGHFNLGFIATYGLELPAGYVWRGTAYALCWIVPLVYASGRILDRREG